MYILDTLKNMNCGYLHMSVVVSRQCVYNRYTEEYELWVSSCECGGEQTVCI